MQLNVKNYFYDFWKSCFEGFIWNGKVISWISSHLWNWSPTHYFFKLRGNAKQLGTNTIGCNHLANYALQNPPPLSNTTTNDFLPIPTILTIFFNFQPFQNVLFHLLIPHFIFLLCPIITLVLKPLRKNKLSYTISKF